jgi:hypothetical protein
MCMQNKLRYACKQFWQGLLHRGIHLYSNASLKKAVGFEAFRESCREASLWKAALLWNESHASEAIDVRVLWEDGGDLYLELLNLLAKLHREGQLEDSVVRQLVPELLQGLTGYLRMLPELSPFYRDQEGLYDLLESLAYFKTEFPAVAGDHPKLGLHGAVDACKGVVYLRVLRRLHKVSGYVTKKVMRSARLLELPTEKLSEEVSLALVGSHFRKFRRKMVLFVSELAALNISLSGEAQERFCCLVTEYFTEICGSANLPIGMAHPILSDYAAVAPSVSVEIVDAALEAESRNVSQAVQWTSRWAEMAQELGLQASSQEEAQEAALQVLRDKKGSGDVQAAVDAMRRVTDAALHHLKQTDAKSLKEEAEGDREGGMRGAPEMEGEEHESHR